MSFPEHVAIASNFALGTILAIQPRRMPEEYAPAMRGFVAAVAHAKGLRGSNPTGEQAALAVRQLRASSAEVRRVLAADRYALQRGTAPITRALDKLDNSLSQDALRGLLNG